MTEVCENTKYPVMIDMPGYNTGDMGAMKLEKLSTIFKKKPNNSVLRQLCDIQEKIAERHRHRYEVNPEYIEVSEKAGMHPTL